MFIAGNWKMNGTVAQARVLAQALVNGLPDGAPATAIFPPAIHLAAVHDIIKDSPIFMGGQDCSSAENGAHTGDLSVAMLADIGARGVIVGHSERRTDHGESNEAILGKVKAAQSAGLGAVLCVGETLDERQSGRAETVVQSQLAACLPTTFDSGSVVIAYEPVWAIGTGMVATVQDISAMHSMIRQWLQAHRPEIADTFILYGGSVKAANAADVFGADEVGGALVGGASLKSDDFLGIIAAAMKA
ncbi:MAG: triose-phosphate isomerase [Alphaproteobacteria bacterium]|nr:triose-phosphate isomerase [Alphaproteobacteria bacterium]